MGNLDEKIDHLIKGGTNLFKRGLYREAESVFLQLNQLRPKDVSILLELARSQFALRKLNRCIQTCKGILTVEQGHQDAYILMAYSMMPGENYIQNLKRLHLHLKPATYLEIGVETGQSLALTVPATRAIGVDPEMDILHKLSDNTQIFSTTSDQFFETQDLEKLFDGKNVEMAFIDGMHLFDFALRDFINIEKGCNPNSVILIHDCFPVDEISSSRNRETNFWSGDVWKIMGILKEFRPDLNAFTIPTAPTGMGVVTRLNPSSNVLANQYDNIVEKYLKLTFGEAQKNKEIFFSLCPNDWSEIQKKLMREIP